jgi:integrase
MPERYRELVMFLAYTGLRIGEALGLRWRAVNLEDDWCIVDGEALAPNSILITEAWVRGERTTPKKRASWRKIPLTTTAWVAIMMQREASKFSGNDDPVFAARNGEPMDAHNIAARFLKPAGKAIGCQWVSWHHLRHTASTLTDAYLTPAQKQAILGHAGTGIGLRYTHPEIEATRAAMERAESLNLTKTSPIDGPTKEHVN